METVVKKYVAKPRRKQSETELNKIQKSIDITLQQITAVENDPDAIMFGNEASAVSLKKKQLEMLQRRKTAIESNDRVAGKKYRKIDLDFLKRTKKRHVVGKLSGNRVELTVKTPLYSFHRLSKYQNKYEFNKCEMRFDVKGGTIGYLYLSSISDDHPIAQRIHAIYKKTKMPPVNIIRWIYGHVADRDIRISMTDKFSGLIPTDVKKECIEAHDMFDDVFLVKEANWQIELIEKDPLIIGILNGEAYLVSHFDCTPFEYYAKSEF
jgi:hypothetical protein